MQKYMFPLLKCLKQYVPIPYNLLYRVYAMVKNKEHYEYITRINKFDFVVKCDISDWIPFNIYFWGIYEKYESLYFHKLINKGMTCFDVGANIGYYSMLFASKGAEVHAFEAVARNAEKLTENAQLNLYSNIRINHLAASNNCEPIKIFLSPDANGNHSAINQFLSGQFELCSAITIDAYCSLNNIRHIDVIKIDVEGSEINVVHGMERMIGENRVDYILMEFIHDDPAYIDLFNTLIRVFDSYTIEKGTKLKAIGMPPFSGNVLFIRKNLKK
ncbi:MAG: hypothetical protein A2X41_02605 [Candidatus Margulisbacteria bacterium GWE2_39_32]|nr:MAG: hypothetical protein A2X41_02605 [Candidatus Margulisbacteria bacterium GWE2_39_32]